MHTVNKKISLKKQNENIAGRLCSKYDLFPMTGRILAARGFDDDDDLRNFLEPTLAKGLPAPEGLLNVIPAANLISQIALDGGAIAIACDFDVDGLSSGAQLFDLLKEMGVGVKVFVPDRFEDGYGLNENIVKEAAKEGFALLVCLDFGTSSHKELALAKKLGLKTIVVDHHHVEEAPPCDVFINPQQKECGFAKGLLCSAGLTWYLGCALRKISPSLKSFDPKSHLELASLGTICDMVPLLGPNRVIAKKGLEAISKSLRPGMIALKEVASVKSDATCTDVSFAIGPRLNAAGRIENGNKVIELLTTKNLDRARMIARNLDNLNRERQETENEVRLAAIEEISKRQKLGTSIVLWNQSFHTGVVGIVAQRLVEAYYRPAVVLGLDEPGIYKGSVRGIKGMSVVEALSKAKKYLIKFGGHEGAGGLSIKEENLDKFAKAFEEICAELSSDKERIPVAEADTECEFGEVSVALVDQLDKLAPFGMKNGAPQVLIKGVRIGDVTVLKNAHLKAVLSDGKRVMTGLLWRQTFHPEIKTGAIVNIVMKLDYNNYNGLTELQGHIVAVEKA